MNIELIRTVDEPDLYAHMLAAINVAGQVRPVSFQFRRDSFQLRRDYSWAARNGRMRGASASQVIYDEAFAEVSEDAAAKIRDEIRESLDLPMSILGFSKLRDKKLTSVPSFRNQSL
jgi:hypothetical protein